MKRRTLLTIASPNNPPERFSTVSLADAPDDVLQYARPQLAPDARIKLDGDRVNLVSDDGASPCLFSTSDAGALFFFNGFNGEQTVLDIARQYASQQQLPEQDCLQRITTFARDLFRRGVIVPVNQKHK